MAIYGQDFVSNLTPVEFSGERYSLSGLVSTPEISKINRKNQIFFVNHRPIRSPMLYKAVDEAYRGLLISREFPIVFLFITVPPEEVDVNVHPQKTEVRFKDEKTVFKMVCGILRNSLEEIEYKFTGEIKPDQLPFIPSFNPKSNMSKITPYFEKSLQGFETKFSDNENRIEFIPLRNKTEWSMGISEPATLEYKVIGQCLNSYIMIESNSELWLVDQHAAHERINYARLRENQNSNRELVQVLAIPLIMQIAADKMQLLERNRQLLIKIGLDIDIIGPNTIALRAAPLGFQGKEFEVINELLDLLEDEKIIDLEHETIAMMACKKSIKAGECLTMAEMEKIIKDFFAVNDFRNCPHGRPTMLCLSRQEIDRRFKRL
jgi:DNA mismatch repair protein MutL